VHRDHRFAARRRLSNGRRDNGRDDERDAVLLGGCESDRMPDGAQLEINFVPAADAIAMIDCAAGSN
jgi:hypothetical protein